MCRQPLPCPTLQPLVDFGPLPRCHELPPTLGPTPANTLEPEWHRGVTEGAEVPPEHQGSHLLRHCRAAGAKGGHGARAQGEPGSGGGVGEAGGP